MKPPSGDREGGDADLPVPRWLPALCTLPWLIPMVALVCVGWILDHNGVFDREPQIAHSLILQGILVLAIARPLGWATARLVPLSRHRINPMQLASRVHATRNAARSDLLTSVLAGLRANRRGVAIVRSRVPLLVWVPLLAVWCGVLLGALAIVASETGALPALFGWPYTGPPPHPAFWRAWILSLLSLPHCLGFVLVLGCLGPKCALWVEAKIEGSFRGLPLSETRLDHRDETGDGDR